MSDPFESAVEAIIHGDAARVAQLLRETPDLVHQRSAREHRSTLLHYVSANGVEDERQITPQNIVEIADTLLAAGADVNAESDAYSGRSTTLMLTATSCHPEAAGVQIPLLEFLIARGATIDNPDGSSAVKACLHNGRGLAAEYLAGCGARLDLEGAAGVGNLEIVQSFFSEDGALRPAATETQLQDGFAWACEFGRTSVVRYLLERGMEMKAKLRPHGQTGLHWAAWGAHVDIVQVLLQHGAPVDVRDETHDGTPLEWAVYAWSFGPPTPAANRYRVVAQLVNAGATLDRDWFTANENRCQIAKRLETDPQMAAALRGQLQSD